MLHEPVFMGGESFYSPASLPLLRLPKTGLSRACLLPCLQWGLAKQMWYTLTSTCMPRHATPSTLVGRVFHSVVNLHAYILCIYKRAQRHCTGHFEEAETEMQQNFFGLTTAAAVCHSLQLKLLYDAW